MRHKASKSAGLFVFRLAKQNKTKRTKISRTGCKAGNRACKSSQCIRQLCLDLCRCQKNMHRANQKNDLTGHVSHDCDLAKGTEQGLHTESSSSIDLMMIINM